MPGQRGAQGKKKGTSVSMSVKSEYTASGKKKRPSRSYVAVVYNKATKEACVLRRTLPGNSSMRQKLNYEVSVRDRTMHCEAIWFLGSTECVVFDANGDADFLKHCLTVYMKALGFRYPNVGHVTRRSHPHHGTAQCPSHG